MGSCTSGSPEQEAWRPTPLIESPVLSRVAGCRIFLKLENLQPAASFKSRGLGFLVEQHVIKARQSSDFDPENLHFFTSSGGNAGLACVTAAHAFGIKSTVVIPSSSPESILIKMKAAGASEVIVCGSMWAEADQHLRESIIPAAEKRGEKAVYVHPFDNPILWDGYASMITEIKERMPNNSRPDAIVCSVGGGGLFSGVMHGLDQEGWADTVQVFACETVGADSLSQALQANEHIAIPGITSIARSLGAVKVSKQAFTQAQRPTVRSVVLPDRDAAEACWRFADDERMLVEPACGVSVALAYHNRLRDLLKGFSKDSKVVIIVCGGNLVSLADLDQWKETYGPQLPSLKERETEEVKVPSSLEA